MKLSDLKNLNKVEYYNSEILGEPELDFDKLKHANFQLFRNGNVNFIQFINVDNKKIKLNNAFVITFEVKDLFEDITEKVFHEDFVKGSDLIKYVFENKDYEYEYISRSGTNFQIRVSKKSEQPEETEETKSDETNKEKEQVEQEQVEQPKEKENVQQQNQQPKSKFNNKNRRRFDGFR